MWGMFRFDGQIEIEGDNGLFAQPGDSGSLVVDRDKMLGVGLLFAGPVDDHENGDAVIYANPLSVVLDQLGVDLLIAKPRAS
jgi:hypothetical protein